MKSLLGVLAGHVHKGYACCEGGKIHGEVQAMEKGHGPSLPYLSTHESEGPQHTKACRIRIGDFK